MTRAAYAVPNHGLTAINDLSRHIAPLASSVEAAISRVISSGWYSLGHEVEAFETEFANYCQTGHCVSLANGSDALELALRALDIGPGCRVLTVANAGAYSTGAIVANGATPIYADVCADGAMDAADAAPRLRDSSIDALVLTHLYGLMADRRGLIDIARAKQIPVVEDCAQAHGAMLDGRMAGTLGDIGCFSFYPTKNLGALGDGGAIITARAELAGRLRQLRQYGWDAKYRVALPGGRNSRLDEIQAAVLRTLLPHLDGWNARRREIGTLYSSGIRNEKIATPRAHAADDVVHLYTIKTASRDELRNYLAQAGIPSEIHYPIPDYRQPGYAHLFSAQSLPATDKHCSEVLSLPCFPEMTDAEIAMIIEAINAW